MMEITYSYCLLAVLGQKFWSFPSLEKRYENVVKAFGGEDFQICARSSEECLLSQILSSGLISSLQSISYFYLRVRVSKFVMKSRARNLVRVHPSPRSMKRS